MNPLRADQIGPLDMFKIGIGPSSAHTVGPMIAALEFRKSVVANAIERLPKNSPALRMQVELFGSLSFTGRGHSTDGAVCAGLSGMHPRTSSPEEVWAAMPALRQKPEIEI